MLPLGTAQEGLSWVNQEEGLLWQDKAAVTWGLYHVWKSRKGGKEVHPPTQDAKGWYNEWGFPRKAIPT